MDVKNFTPPTIVTVPTHQELVDRFITRLQTLDPDYVPVVTDDAHLIFDAAAYEMLLILAEMNTVVKGLLIPFATYPELDALVAPTERIDGEKPTAPVTFTLSVARDTDSLIPDELELTDGNGSKAYLMGDVTIPAGELTAPGTIELDAYVETSDIETEIVVTPLPFVASVTQDDSFGGGADREDDESLRQRYYAADDVPSTAGSVPGYEYHAKSADSRIKDLKVATVFVDIEPYVPQLINQDESTVRTVLNQMLSDMKNVQVVYYAPTMDAAMQTRLEEVLLDEQIKPLTDQVTIAAAEIVSFDVTATLKIYTGYDISQVYSEALKSLEDGVMKLRRIGRDVLLSKLTALLHVDGVAEVVFTSPAANVSVSDTQVAEHDTITLSTEVYSGD